MDRAYNFSAGPSAIPEDVLKTAGKEILNYKNSGASIMEISHRSKIYETVHNEALGNIRELFKVPENFNILFLQGGASGQFFMVPMNLLTKDDTADYINSGTWATKAIQEAKILNNNIKVIATSKETNFDHIPESYTINKGAKYLHITTNNTIFGTQYKKLPETNGVPLVMDSSSDIFSYHIDWKNIGLIYAGAQKNAGPSGIVIVIIRKDLCVERNDIPTMLRYKTHADENSLYNTPPSIAVYLMGLTLKWLKDNGGVQEMEKLAGQKAKLIYDVIDESNGYFRGHSQKNSRSHMNITFNLPNEELNEKFAKESESAGFIGLKGHRSVGGIRASIYNAVTVEACEKLVSFMNNFKKNN